MRSIGMKTFGLLAAAAAYSHAIFGIGAQWAPAPGLEVESSSGAIGTTGVTLDQGAVDGLNGLGLKLWIDFLPFVDVELTSNVQYGYYDLSFTEGAQTVDVEFDLGVPFVDEKPAYARILSDVSVLYPFLKLPPGISIVKLYAGAGFTHVLSTAVANQSFVNKAVAKATAADPGAADSPADVADIVADEIVDEGLNSGVGFHIMAGAKAKPPIIPLSVFANVKYHFLNDMPGGVDETSMTLELGGAFGF
jgi:hypothetical protein